MKRRAQGALIAAGGFADDMDGAGVLDDEPEQFGNASGSVRELMGLGEEVDVQGDLGDIDTEIDNDGEHGVVGRGVGEGEDQPCGYELSTRREPC